MDRTRAYSQKEYARAKHELVRIAAELGEIDARELGSRRILAELNGQIDDLSSFVRPLQTRLTALRANRSREQACGFVSPKATSPRRTANSLQIAEIEAHLGGKHERLRSLKKKRQHLEEVRCAQSARVSRLNCDRNTQLRIVQQTEREWAVVAQDKIEARAREKALELQAAAGTKHFGPDLKSPISRDRPVSHQPGGISRDPRETFARRNRGW